MKLFLSSETISFNQGPAFVKLIGKPAKDIKLALIENAADVEEGEKLWLAKNREAIKAHGIQVVDVDLNGYKDGKPGLKDVLDGCDAIWLGGGNTFYLRWLLKEIKADSIISGLAKRGKVYGGSSAGAIMAGPTLKFIDEADNPKKAPKLLWDGLNLIDTVVIPHWADEKYGHIIKSIEQKLQKAGHKTVHITNDQAVVIDGETQIIVP